MKKIISIAFGVAMLAFGSVSTASAYYRAHPTNSYNYQYVNVQPSYYYTAGCYTFYHDGGTGSNTVTSYNCQTYTYTQPVTTYTQPVTQTYYASPYYTYLYNTVLNSWSPSSYYSTGYTNTGYDNYYSNYGYTQTQQNIVISY